MVAMNDTVKTYLKLVKQRPVYFGIEAGFKDLTDLNNEWIKLFLFHKGDQTLQAHRGSYKTTCLAVAMSLMAIIYPDNNLIFMRKTDDDVKEIVLQVAKMLKTNIFNDLAKALYGQEIFLTKETAFEIDTNLKTSSRGASQLQGLGLRASITGKHADIIITDDIINVSDRISKADRERTKYAYQELQNVKNRGGRIINTGTPWHKEDAFTLMPNIKKWDCYSTGLMTDEDIDKIRRSMSPSLFAANYELKHIADEEAMFTAPQFCEKDITNGIAHIDAAYGGSDYTSYTIAKLVDNRFIVFGKVWQKHVDDCLKEIEAYHREYMAGTIYCETNADKGYLKKKIVSAGLPCTSYHERQNKFIKISTILRLSLIHI